MRHYSSGLGLRIAEVEEKKVVFAEAMLAIVDGVHSWW